jgi:hypothetical protein
VLPTTGQLRAALRRAVIAADPEGARTSPPGSRTAGEGQPVPRRRGHLHLCGSRLPTIRAAAAMARISAMARAWKAAGAGGGIDLLSAEVYIGLLLGPCPASRPPKALRRTSRLALTSPVPATMVPASPVAARMIPEGTAPEGTAPEPWTAMILVLATRMPLKMMASMARTPSAILGVRRTRTCPLPCRHRRGRRCPPQSRLALRRPHRGAPLAGCLTSPCPGPHLP